MYYISANFVTAPRLTDVVCQAVPSCCDTLYMRHCLLHWALFWILYIDS